MNSKFQKVLMSTALAASLGAVAVAAPIGGSHAYAATNEKSNHDQRKDKAERIANNAAFLEAQEAQFQAMFGTKDKSTTNDQATTEETTTNEAPAVNSVTVVVPQGASLTEIAAQYGVTVDELVAANNLLPAGYQLTVPQK